jgi:hypothetical protein
MPRKQSGPMILIDLVWGHSSLQTSKNHGKTQIGGTPNYHRFKVEGRWFKMPLNTEVNLRWLLESDFYAKILVWLKIYTLFFTEPMDIMNRIAGQEFHQIQFKIKQQTTVRWQRFEGDRWIHGIITVAQGWRRPALGWWKWGDDIRVLSLTLGICINKWNIYRGTRCHQAQVVRISKDCSRIFEPFRSTPFSSAWLAASSFRQLDLQSL